MAFYGFSVLEITRHSTRGRPPPATYATVVVIDHGATGWKLCALTELTLALTIRSNLQLSKVKRSRLESNVGEK